MTEVEFEKYLMFWKLKGQISPVTNLGRKLKNNIQFQTKRIRITSKDYDVELTYMVSNDPVEYHISHGDFTHNSTGISVLFAGKNALDKLDVI